MLGEGCAPKVTFIGGEDDVGADAVGIRGGGDTGDVEELEEVIRLAVTAGCKVFLLDACLL